MLMKRLLICTALFCFTSFKIQGNFFLAKKCDDYWCTKGNYICITNTSFALSWNNPEVKETLQQVSNFTPKPKQKYFDCQIKSDEMTNQYFRKDNWYLSSSFNELILDERWEEMKTIRTKFVSDYKQQLKFEHVLEINATYFDIFFSIRTEKEAHIFLCDGADVSKSNCYWLLLQAFSGEASSIRKCPKGLIPVINNDWPKTPCKDRLVNVSHSQVPNFLSNQTWNHFVLSKRDETLTFREADTDQSNSILKLRDTQEPINIKHMIVHSKMVNALWKIHKLDYLYTTNVSSWTLGPAIYVQEGSICISMYISMCSTCRLKLGLISGGSIISHETYMSEHAGWFKIKFVRDDLQNLYDQRVGLVVSTVNLGQQSFWKIDNIRLCKKEEFRMIGLSEKASCQLMSNKDDIIEFNEETRVSISENHCPEDTIGSFCFRCSLTFNNCEKITVCTKNECTCSAGYYEKNCYYECGNGYYGHDCRKQCGKCYYKTCNNIDGTCTRCTEGYAGPKCDIPPTIIFAHSPKVTEVGYTTATVQVSNFQIENQRPDNFPRFYTIQYKKDDRASDWIETNATVEFNRTANYEIKNLLPDTKYFVKAVIYSERLEHWQDSFGQWHDRLGQWEDGDHLKFRMFTTKCESISEQNIQTVTTNTSVLISLILLKDITCKSYSVSLFELPNAMRYSNQNGTYFLNLKPFTEYTVIVNENSGRSEKKFTTTEGVPTPIRDLKTTASSSTTIKLEWTQAENIYGTFKSYVIKYKHTAYMGCNKESPEPSNAQENEKEVTDTSITLQNLIPYSVYTVTVYATNSKFDGVAESLTVSTDPEDEIGHEETPTIFNITESQDSTNIELSRTNCEKFRGPLILKVASICTSSWCAEQTRKPKKLQRTLPVGLVTLKDLTPFSDYTVQIKYCRFNGSCTEPEKKTFKTKPSVPGKVKDVLIYTKNTTSISLRWKPPYPPTGILNNYKIEYYYYSKSYKQEEVFNITHCKLWPKLHCATLYGLKSEKYYIITITAQNEEPDGFGDPETDRTSTRIEPSKAPYDLYVQWSSRNELNLEWKHPNQTNGDIQYFAILINGPNYKEQNIEKQFPVSEDTYNLTYYYQINSTDISPTTPYTINIYAYNGQNGYTASIPTQSPPDLPTLTAEPEFDSSNESITTTLMLNKPRGQSNNYRLLVLKSDQKNNLESYPELNEYDLKNLRVVIVCNINTVQEPYILNIGHDQDSPNPNCEDKDNSPLNPATPYNITVVLVNTYNSLTRSNIYTYSYNTTGEPLPSDINSSLFGLLVLLLIIPLIAILYKKREHLMSIKDNLFKQNNTSREVLEIQEDQIPLAQRTNPNPNIQVPKRVSKTQPKPPTNPNPTSKIYSKPIKITEFEKYVKESIKDGELERQHAIFPRGQTKSWDYGALKENKSKNRYNNLIAYDHSRVVLEKTGDPHSDYINANYINGHKISKAYIATQGPKAATLNDFWRMIWQENVKCIANLANIYEGGKKKVEKYWPDINETLKFGEITVQHMSRNVYADYEHRVFTVTYNEESRKVEQLHFSSWPDHGVPLYSQSLVPFLQKLLQVPLNTKSPIVVHCSAGVGRTGTILLCDISLRMAAREGTIDLLRNLQLLREQRANMVDNIEQYKLAHLVVLECLVGLHTSIPCNEIDESVEKLLINGSLTLQMRYLKDTQWQDQAMKSVAHTGTGVPVVPEKNRFENIIPEIQGRIFLNRYPLSDESSSYINAVKVDGFRSPDRFIVTQQPLPTTLGDFWRLVDENSNSTYSVILSLNEINPREKTSCKFWPTTTNPKMNPVPYITLKHSNTQILKHYDVTVVHLTSESRKEVLPVQILSLKRWAPLTNCPKTIEEFLAFWEETDSVSRGASPIFVTCHDGVTASGLFLALSFVIEKMKLEQVCDVCQAVRTVRHNRQQFVQDLEQFEFLYKAAVLYINGFESYANFN